MSHPCRAFALILLLLVCLLVTAPARLLGLVLSPGQVLMQGFSGTLWQGKASRCLVKTQAGYLHLGAVGWHLDPLSLLLLSPRLTLDSNWGSQTLATGMVLRGSDAVDLYEMEANIPADLLRQFVPVSLAGVLSVQLSQLKLRAGLPIEGAGRLVWQDGSWNSPTGPVPLGSYALDFKQVADAGLEAELVTLAGVVGAQGSVQLRGRSYDIDITVRSKGGLDERLRQALSLLARPVGQGYRIKLDGELQEPPGQGSEE